MKQLLETIVKPLVDEPEQVVVTETETDDTLLLELRVAHGDMGKVIGKQGRIAKAIRTLMKGAAKKLGNEKKIVVDILD